jgi:hypothetical protein
MMPTPEQIRRSRVIEIAEEGPVSVPAVMALARRVKALVEKGDRAADKAEQFYKAAGIHIKEIKEQCPLNWEGIVQHRCGIGRSRAYELMAIADGRTTLEKVRASTNDRKKVHRAKSKSVPERTEQEAEVLTVADGTMGDACLMRYLETERTTGSAEVGIEQRRAEYAALDAESDVTEIADPATIEDNLLYSIQRMNEHARVFKKFFRASTFDREARERISTAIDRMIQKWRSTQSALQATSLDR